MRSRDPQNQGGGAGAVGTQDHGGLREPGETQEQGGISRI